MPTLKNSYRLYIALVGTAALVLGVIFVVRAIENRAPVDTEEAEAMQVQTDLNTQLMQDRLSDDITGGTTRGSQERMDSPLGLAMFRKCIEWTEFYDNHPSDHSRQNRDSACQEYRAYVESGTLPEDETAD